MQDFFDALAFAYTQITKNFMMRFIVAVGLIVIGVWSFVGYYFWSDIITISTSLIEFVPFSFIKSNSATLLSAFLYMQVVMVTFALVYAFVFNLYLQRVKEKYGGLLSLSMILLSAAVWGVVWLRNEELIHAKMEKLFSWLPFETVEMTLAYLLGFYLVYNMIIVTMTLMASLFSKRYLLQIKEKEFPYDTVYENDKKVILYTLRDIVIYLVVSLLFFPILFIPVLNVFIQIILWVWLAKDTLFYDSAVMLFKEPSKKELKKYRFAIWNIGIVGSLFNFIPIINIFGPFFNEIAIFSYLKAKRDFPDE